MAQIMTKSSYQQTKQIHFAQHISQISLRHQMHKMKDVEPMIKIMERVVPPIIFKLHSFDKRIEPGCIMVQHLQ